MKRLWLSPLFLVLISAAGDRELAIPGPGLKPHFIPAASIAEAHIETLPVDEAARRSLRELLAAEADPRPCVSLLEKPNTEPWQLLDFALPSPPYESVPVVAAGSVVATTVGFELDREVISTLVSVEVDKRVGTGVVMQPGAVLHLSVPSGTLELPGKTLTSCEARYLPSVGDRVVIVGGAPQSGGLLPWGWAHLLDGERVSVGNSTLLLSDLVIAGGDS